MKDPLPIYTPLHDFTRLDTRVARIIEQMDELEERVRELETMLPTAKGFSVEDYGGYDDDLGDGNFT